MKIGVYPGTFDPITFGHLDIIARGCKLFDKLYVAVPINPNKKTFFSLEERVELIKKVLKEYHFDNVEVVSTNKLTVEFARSVNANFMLRGLRAVTDFEYELQLDTLNKSLAKEIETIFIMSSHEYSFLSSSVVKEIAMFHGDVSKLVPNVVRVALENKNK